MSAGLLHQPAGSNNFIRRQLAGFQNHLDGCTGCRLHNGGDIGDHLRMVAGLERAEIKHHIQFISAEISQAGG